MSGLLGSPYHHIRADRYRFHNDHEVAQSVLDQMVILMILSL
jgi:hypothetical protein